MRCPECGKMMVFVSKCFSCGWINFDYHTIQATDSTVYEDQDIEFYPKCA